MFEVGFSELCMVGLVAVLVIGPEQLPKVARIAGYWLGKSRRVVADLKAEAQAELYRADLQQLLLLQDEAKRLQDLLSDTEAALQGVHSEVQGLVQDEIKPLASVAESV